MAKSHIVKSVALPRMKTVKNESHVLKDRVICEIQRTTGFQTSPQHNISPSPLPRPPAEFFNIVLYVRIALTGTITAVSAVTCFALKRPESSDVLYKLPASPLM
jgi:hypothetical protein